MVGTGACGAPRAHIGPVVNEMGAVLRAHTQRRRIHRGRDNGGPYGDGDDEHRRGETLEGHEWFLWTAEVG